MVAHNMYHEEVGYDLILEIFFKNFLDSIKS